MLTSLCAHPAHPRYGVADLFERELPASHPDYVSHGLDMGIAVGDPGWDHHQYECVEHAEGLTGVDIWQAS